MSGVRVTSYAQAYSKAINDEFAKRTKRAAERVRERVRANIAKTGGGRPSKEGEYPRSQSGKLLRGVRTRQTKAAPCTFRVENTAPHAGFLENDTKGGRMIVPRRANVLAFKVWQGAKKANVFTKRVRQGAIKKRGFMARTLAECRPMLKAIYTRGIPDMLKGNKLILRIS